MDKTIIAAILKSDQPIRTNLSMMATLAPAPSVNTIPANVNLSDNTPDVAPTPETTNLTKTYRALSADVKVNWCIPLMFPTNVLRDAVSLAATDPRTQAPVLVMKDHDHTVNSWLGLAQEAKWEDANGTYPAGINVAVEYNDAVLSLPENKAIKIGLESGALRSVSMSVDAEMVRSHKGELDANEWYDQLGEVVNEKLVCLVATKIHGFSELSLVWSGADTYAKERPVASASMSTSLSECPAVSTPKEEKSMNPNEVLASLAETAGVSFNAEDESSMLALKAEVQSKFDLATKLQAELEKSEAVSKAYMAELTERLTNSALIVLGKDAVESIVSLTANTNINTLQTLVKEFELKADSKYEACCPKCGTALTRQSSVTNSETKNTPEDEATHVATDATDSATVVDNKYF